MCSGKQISKMHHFCGPKVSVSSGVIMTLKVGDQFKWKSLQNHLTSNQKACAINSLRVISTVVKYDTPNLIFFHFGWKPKQFRGKKGVGCKYRIHTSIKSTKKANSRMVCPKGYFLTWSISIFWIIEVIQCQSCLPMSIMSHVSTCQDDLYASKFKLWYRKII